MSLLKKITNHFSITPPKPQPITHKPITQPSTSLNDKPMEITKKKRIHAKDRKGNLIQVLERLCWSDCHNGVTVSWIEENISRKFHVTKGTYIHLVTIGFLEKRGGLYFHTGASPNAEMAEKFRIERNRVNLDSKEKVKNAKIKLTQNLFQQTTEQPFTCSQEEYQLIIAIRNFINLQK